MITQVSIDVSWSPSLLAIHAQHISLLLLFKGVCVPLLPAYACLFNRGGRLPSAKHFRLSLKCFYFPRSVVLFRHYVDIHLLTIEATCFPLHLGYH